jgi:hypothetical protein
MSPLTLTIFILNPVAISTGVVVRSENRRCNEYIPIVRKIKMLNRLTKQHKCTEVAKAGSRALLSIPRIEQSRMNLPHRREKQAN